MVLFAVVLTWLAIVGVLIAWHLDNRNHAAQVQSILDRVASSPQTVLLPHADATPLADEVTYVSDLPYHDDLWDEFASANEAASPVSEDE